MGEAFAQCVSICAPIFRVHAYRSTFAVTLFAALFILVCYGMVMYFPQHLMIMQRRAVYYLWGQEGGERLLWQWLGFGAGLHKEL
jgi:hypothetical protein